jgi:hypothetical protein
MITLLKKGQKVIIQQNIPSVDGMLYKDTEVTIDEVAFPDKDLRVKDDLGKIWYVNLSDIRMG